MAHKMVNSGNGKPKYIGVDSWFGRNHEFLDKIPNELIYFADIPHNLLVFLKRPDIVTPEYRGKGRRPGSVPSFSPCYVSDIANDPGIPWDEVVLGNGAKGPVIAQDKCVPVVEVRNDMPGKDVWLYIRRLADGSIKYSLCNESMSANKEDIRIPAQMRWSIEQCFGECKDYLGMGQYELRTWGGWHRHMLFTFIAHLFINKLRRLYSLKIDDPIPAPIVDKPVPLEDYRDAVTQANNGQTIDHPDINIVPKEPQQVLTIGLIQKLINPFLVIVGKIQDEIKYLLKSATSAYASNCKSKTEQMLSQNLQPT
jgi:hypothetical protein